MKVDTFEKKSSSVSSFSLLQVYLVYFRVIQRPFGFLQNTPNDPFLHQNHWMQDSHSLQILS